MIELSDLMLLFAIDDITARPHRLRREGLGDLTCGLDLDFGKMMIWRWWLVLQPT